MADYVIASVAGYHGCFANQTDVKPEFPDRKNRIKPDKK